MKSFFCEQRTDTSLRGNGSASAEVGHINSLPDDIMFVIWSFLSLHHRLRAESGIVAHISY